MLVRFDKISYIVNKINWPMCSLLNLKLYVLVTISDLFGKIIQSLTQVYPVLKTVDPDQLAEKPADQDPHCFPPCL